MAYTLLANHVALQTELIGAHEHESYYLFDICYHNTSEVTPTAHRRHAQHDQQGQLPCSS